MEKPTASPHTFHSVITLCLLHFQTSTFMLSLAAASHSHSPNFPPSNPSLKISSAVMSTEGMIMNRQLCAKLSVCHGDWSDVLGRHCLCGTGSALKQPLFSLCSLWVLGWALQTRYISKQK